MWPDDIVPWIILAIFFFHILDNPFAFVAYCKLNINIFLNISLKYVPQKESLSTERPLQRPLAETRKDCPICGKKSLLKLSNHLAELHQLSCEAREQYHQATLDLMSR